VGPPARNERQRQHAAPVGPDVRDAAWIIRILCTALCLMPAVARATAPTSPVFLAFLNAPQGRAPLRVPPRLLVSFGGRPVAAVMDTGSTGIVISASAIPDVAKLPGPSGFVEYSSSGRIERGRWIETPVTIRGANGQSVTTRPIRVLAVTRVDCISHARNCRVRVMPQHVAMLGVGFGREADHQPESTPDRNPFLTIAGPVPLWRGYIVTRQGVTLGLNESVSHSFATIRLARSRSVADWDQTPACIAIAGAQPACGMALIDTGVVVMYLSAPLAPLSAELTDGLSLRSGTQLTISLPVPTRAAASYAITVGAPPNATAPERVILVPHRRTFVNTSLRFLNGFDYLFNDSLGMVGFRPNRSD
jgi:hypothetical protein